MTPKKYDTIGAETRRTEASETRDQRRQTEEQLVQAMLAVGTTFRKLGRTLEVLRETAQRLGCTLREARLKWERARAEKDAQARPACAPKQRAYTAGVRRRVREVTSQHADLAHETVRRLGWRRPRPTRTGRRLYVLRQPTWRRRWYQGKKKL